MTWWYVVAGMKTTWAVHQGKEESMKFALVSIWKRLKFGQLTSSSALFFPPKSRLAPCSVRDHRCMGTISLAFQYDVLCWIGLTIFMDLSVCCSFACTLKASLHMWHDSSQSRFTESNKLVWLDETLRGVGNLENVNQFQSKYDKFESVVYSVCIPQF